MRPRAGAVEKTRRLVALAINLAILFLWLWLYRPVYAYLGTIFTRQEFRTNQIVLLVVLCLIVIQARRSELRMPFTDPPQLHWPGLVLALAGSAAFISTERWLDINTLSATLFGLATYGLLGLWMDGRAWRSGLPAALLLVGVLPFGEHMETFIGYPLRLATARIVSEGLAALGIPNLGVDTILIFENGLSQVDSPCSGVKSLWSGGMFLLAATWIEARRINRRWLLVAFSFGLLLLAANLARVALLVLTGQALSWGLIAEMLHVPLGVIGFLAACAAALAMLRWAGQPAPAGATPTDQSRTAQAVRPAWLAPALAAVLIGMVLLYTPRLQPAAAAGSAAAWHFPSELVVQEWPLTDIETDWLSSDGALPVTAARWHFEWRGLRGSLLFVTSATWRAQHRPERCFTVYGLEVQESRLLMASADFPLRWLTLRPGSASLPRDPQSVYTAGYWLQSSKRVTDDYSVRIWDDMAPQPEPWVLATVLFDGPIDPASPAAQALFSALRQSVQTGLQRP